jgi:hypothetical protein
MDSPIDSNIATHHAPVAKANSLIHVDLADHGLPGRLEQLWAWRISPYEFEIASLPFFPYDMTLGDTVATRGSEAPDLVVAQVIRRSGHRLLRVGIKTLGINPELHELMHREMIRSGLIFEWHGAEYVAVDLPRDCSEDALLAYLEPLQRRYQIVMEIV